MSTTTRDEILACEQRAVDHAYDCYTTKLAELSGTSAATASASGKDGIANRADAEARAEAYGGLGDEALVFSRVDAPEDPGGDPRPWYIGRRGVHDASHEPVVLMWTSPLAKKWIETRPENPGEVVLRRQLRCVQRIVESYFDEISLPTPAPVPSAVPEPAAVPEPRQAVDDSAADEMDASPAPERTSAPTPGDVVRRQRRKTLQPDDFLLRELQRSRGGRMRDIVETIRRDQMELVTGSPSDILVVQGGPGTGKSAVGLHRVTWLVNNEHFRAQDILVIGPHQRFLDYVGQVLPTLGTRDVNAVQLDRLWEGEILGADSPKARLVKSDERMAAVLRRRVESDYRPEALDALTVDPSSRATSPRSSSPPAVRPFACRRPRSSPSSTGPGPATGPSGSGATVSAVSSSTGSSRSSPTSRRAAGRPVRSAATWNATAGSSALSNASGRPPAPGRPCAASTTRPTSSGTAPTASSTRTSRRPCCGPALPTPTQIRGPSTTTSASKSSEC